MAGKAHEEEVTNAVLLEKLNGLEKLVDQRMSFIERNICTLQWACSILFVALVGAFISHIFG